VQRTLAPRRPHDWAEASDAPIMAAMADTAASMTTSFFMTPPFARSEIRPKVFLLSRSTLYPGHVILTQGSNGIGTGVT
jgi:hypothetical protein